MDNSRPIRAYFISDCHLGASYIVDRRAHEQRIIGWLESIASTVTHLFLLGDIIDYWFEYRYVVPRGYTRFFGALARLADNGVNITWLKGNHDIWLFDYLRDEIGIEVADGVMDVKLNGRRFVMAHGDGVGCQSFAFSVLRSMFRNRLLQRMYASIHPRWTVGFAHAWSSHNRITGKQEHTETLRPDDRYLVFATEYINQHGKIDFFVFGHRHILIDQMGPDNSRVIVLGDAFRMFTYGFFDGKEFTLHRF